MLVLAPRVQLERRRDQFRLQGYLAHEKQRFPRTLQPDYVWGQVVVIGGVLFLMSEEP